MGHSVERLCLLILLLQQYNTELKNILSQKRDDAAYAPEMGEIKINSPSLEDEGTKGTKVDTSGRKPKPRLEDMTRFTMTKRIW